ncbi:retinol dehydrogenase 11-like [Lutzomyia longipalpis]|uniref:retinol dehydrogenase 11-like n=1 Tax=Lutzomyia longipalpis TaxID=7200 RepID=UPI0024843988|nr:retinol dehydrogenase 11-like [Lutzomyia longipalpis]
MDGNNDVWKGVGIAVAVIVSVILLLLLLRKYLQGRKFTKNDVRMDGKVVIVTGANVGIGKETALDLAKRGAKVYLACRNPQRAESARQEIVEKSNNVNVFTLELDLASMESIRNFVDKFKVQEHHLDVLVNNAGFYGPLERTKDGFEMQIGVNHLGHFLLTNLLLDILKNSAPSRIVVVSSDLYALGRIKKYDLNSEKSYNKYAAYCQSKLANMLFTRVLARRLKGSGVTVNCLHPGIVKSSLRRNDRVLACIMQPFALFYRSPQMGAQTSIMLAVDPDLEKVSGKYFSDCREATPYRIGRDDEMAEWLWTESVRLVGIQEAP